MECMMKKAQVENGVVVNIIEVDENNIPEWCIDWPEIAGSFGVNDLYDGVNFSVDPDLLAEGIRNTRDEALKYVDAITNNALRWAALTAEQQQAWADYRQALLDIPQQSGFPHDVVWPTKP